MFPIVLAIHEQTRTMVKTVYTLVILQLHVPYGSCDPQTDQDNGEDSLYLSDTTTACSLLFLAFHEQTPIVVKPDLHPTLLCSR